MVSHAQVVTMPGCWMNGELGNVGASTGLGHAINAS